MCESAAHSTRGLGCTRRSQTSRKPADPGEDGFHFSLHQTPNFHASSTSHLWVLHVYLSCNNILGFFCTLSIAVASACEFPCDASSACAGLVGRAKGFWWHVWDPGSPPSQWLPPLSFYQVLFPFPWKSGFDLLSFFIPLLPATIYLPLASATYFQLLARNCHSGWLTNIYWMPILYKAPCQIPCTHRRVEERVFRGR